MKRNLLMLPCVAAVAIAVFVGKNGNVTEGEKSRLLLQNVEALAQTGEPLGEMHYSNMHLPCYTTPCLRWRTCNYAEW